MKIPKVANAGAGSSFGLGNILGLIFVLAGVLLILSLTGNLPIDLGNSQTILQYGAALGSILGGLSMIFRKKEITLK
ncbi:MAG: hypothetical protein V1831_02920 [Candidatus Woesearchaeota archaeon]